MAKFKKGERPVGRAKGTPNKTTTKLRGFLARVVEDYYTSEQFEDDLMKLEPRERVSAIEKLTAYVAPKQQSTSIDVTEEAKRTIEDKLIELSEEG